MSKIRPNPIFTTENIALALGTYWRELATVVNKHEDGIVAVSAPATASSQGTAGQVAFDADYVYLCVATDTWKRAALSTW